MCKDDGAKPATATQTQTNAPWSGALPYINQGLQGAQSLYQQGGQQYYPGQTYAGTNEALNSGINQLNNIGSTYAGLNQSASTGIQNAGNISSSVADWAKAVGSNGTAENPANSFFQSLSQGQGPGLSTLQDYANGKYLSADNPYFQQMSDNIKAQVLPSINGAFSQAGRGVSGLAGRAQGQGLGDAIGSLAYNNYQQGLSQQQSAAQALAGYGVQGGQGLADIYQNAINNRFTGGQQQLAAGQLGLQAAQLAPSIQNMGINAGNASLLAGTTAQGLQQGALTDNQNRWNAMQNQPYQNLQDYIRNITGQISGTGSASSTGTTAPAQPSFFNQALGGGLAAASFFV